MRRLILPGLLIVVAALLAACGTLEIGITPSPDIPATVMPTDEVPAATPDASVTEAPVVTEEPAVTEGPSATENPDGEVTVEDCLAPGEGQAQVIDEEAGYCFLYPASFRVVERFSQYPYQTALVGEPLDPNTIEPIAVSMQVETTGPATYISTSMEYAQMWRDESNFTDLAVAEIDMNGYPAGLVRGMPGMPGGSGAFVVADGMKYRISVQPEVGMWEGLNSQIDELWDMVSSSIQFFGPSADFNVVMANEVCPTTPVEGMELLMNLTEGYCYLYPAEFEQTPEFPGGIVAGPTVDVPDFGPMRARLVIAWAGFAEGKTPRELIQPWAETGLDMSTVEDLTVGGYPAVSYLDTRGPVDQPGMHIVANDQVYTVVANPYEPEDFPELAAIIDEMWESMTGSIQFFTPWR